MFVDSHCHLNMLVDHKESPISMEDLVASAKGHDIEKMLCVAVNTYDWPEMKAMCEPYKSLILLSAGIHPCYMDDEGIDLLEEQSDNDQVVAIGETGLDFHYCRDDDVRDKQKASFAAHIDLSKRKKKPLIVHTRDAKKETIDLLKSEKAFDCGGVMHCYTEDIAMAKKALDLGFYISFSGILTFKNADSLREVANFVPLDRILIETDSPYLAPIPYRGKVNRPEYVRFVAEQLAVLKGMTTSQIAILTTSNFNSLFLS